MTTLAVLILFLILLGIGFYFLERSKENHEKSHSHWQPDVDSGKANTMKNLETPPDR